MPGSLISSSGSEGTLPSYLLFHHDAGGFVQVDDAPVASQVLSDPDRLRARRIGERVYGRKARQEALVERHGALYLDLLQHHLGDEHPPRVSRTAPRQVAPILLEPGEQSRS